MHTFYKKTIVFALLLAFNGTLNAASLDLDTLPASNKANFTQENYTAPVEQEQPAALPQETAKDDAHADVDPNGPWMLCDIQADGLKNIRKKTVLKNISAKEGRLYPKSSIQEDVSSLMALGNFDNAEVDLSAMDGTKKNKEKNRMNINGTD